VWLAFCLFDQATSTSFIKELLYKARHSLARQQDIVPKQQHE
jgi:hypothetical protein